MDKIELNLIDRMIDNMITKTGSISQSNNVTFYYDDLKELLEQYTNQRVIDELERLAEYKAANDGIWSDRVLVGKLGRKIDNTIKELKK